MSRIFKELKISESTTRDRPPADLRVVPPLNQPLGPRLPPPSNHVRRRVPPVAGAAALLALLGIGALLWKAMPHPVNSAQTESKSEAALTPQQAAVATAVAETAPVKLTADQEAHQKALDLYRAKDYAQAHEQFERLLKKFPRSFSLLNNDGIALMKTGDYKGAAAQFKKALKISPKDGVTYNNLGSLSLALEDADEAVSHFYQAILYQPDLLEAHLNLAKAFELSGHPMEAVPEYQYFLDHAPATTEPALRKSIEKRIVFLKAYANAAKAD